MQQPRILPAVVVMGLFVLFVVYAVVTMGTEDPLWAVPYFDGHPGSIVIHCEGSSTTLNPNDVDYAAVNDALNVALRHVVGYHDTLGLSEESVEDYRQRYVAVEAFYPEPVVIHSRFSFGKPNSLLIPLTGRHSQYNVVFGGRNGSYWPGPLALKDLELLRDLLVELGYCATME